MRRGRPPKNKPPDGLEAIPESLESQASLTNFFGNLNVEGSQEHMDSGSNPPQEQDIHITAIVMFREGEVIVPLNCIFVSSGMNDDDERKKEKKIKSITDTLDETQGQYQVVNVSTKMNFESPITKIVGVSKNYLHAKFILDAEKKKYAKKKKKSGLKLRSTTPPKKQKT